MYVSPSQSLSTLLFFLSVILSLPDQDERAMSLCCCLTLLFVAFWMHVWCGSREQTKSTSAVRWYMLWIIAFVAYTFWQWIRFVAMVLWAVRWECLCCALRWLSMVIVHGAVWNGGNKSRWWDVWHASHQIDVSCRRVFFHAHIVPNRKNEKKN